MSAYAFAVLVLVVGALVHDGDRQALVEEGHLPEPRGQRLVGVGGGLEDVRAGVEGDRGAGLLARLQPLQRAVRVAEAEALAPAVAVPLDLDDQAVPTAR